MLRPLFDAATTAFFPQIIEVNNNEFPYAPSPTHQRARLSVAVKCAHKRQMMIVKRIFGRIFNLPKKVETQSPPTDNRFQKVRESATLTIFQYKKYTVVAGFAWYQAPSISSNITMKLPCSAVILASAVACAHGQASSFDFVARHYFPAGYKEGTTSGVPDQ